MENTIYNTLNALSDKNRQRNIVFYGRVSTEHEAQLSALQNQMQWYDDQLKYHSNWVLIDRYIDEGITGTQAKKRPAFLRMMEDAKIGKFDLIVTREVCRFARNTVDTLIYTRELKSKYGIEVFFVEDNIWTMDGDGELRLTIMATLAQEESRKVSERVKAGQKISRDNGVLYGSGNILGYNRVGDAYVIDEEQAETVRLIYQLYLDGMGERKIMNELMKRGRKDANGNTKWTVSKINRILKRSTYTGILAYGQSYSNNYLEQKRVNNKNRQTYEYKEMEEKIPAIISIDDWERVQQIRTERSKSFTVMGTNCFKTVGNKRTSDVWLRKLKCKCGSNFRRNKWRTNKKDNQICYGYQCYAQINYGSKQFRIKNGLDTEGFCDVIMVADWKLRLMATEVLSSVWENRIDSIIKAYQMIADCYTEEPSNSQKQINELTAKIKKIKNKINNLIEMRAEGEITKEEYAAARNKLDNEMKQYEYDLQSFQSQKIEKINVEDKLLEIQKILSESIDFSNGVDDYLIERFVERITPLDDYLFRWYIKVTNNPTPPEEYFIGIQGRKNNPSVCNEQGEIRLPLYQYLTGCYSTKVGEYLNYKIIIPYEKAKEYRKKRGQYLRFNQWKDIEIEVCILI